MKLFLSLCIVLCLIVTSRAGIYNALNPTKLWEFRDSLQTVSQNNPLYTQCKEMLTHIQDLNVYMSKVKDIVPFPRLRIDVVVAGCPARATEIDAIQKRLEKEEFYRIATDCGSIRTINQYAATHRYCKVLDPTYPALSALIGQLAHEADPQMQYLCELAKMVQCEYAMITLGFSLKQHRLDHGNPNKDIAGLLVVDGYFVESHLKTILRIVHARSNLN